MGRVEDKKRKIALAIDMTPGVEDLISEVKNGDSGLTLYKLSTKCCRTVRASSKKGAG